MDIVEAFTAMRHEWRGQTRESRALAEQIQAAVTNIQSLESALRGSVANARSGSDGGAEARPLVLLIVEADHQLSRAISAIADWETHRRRRAEADRKAVERYFAGMSGPARWFARPLLEFFVEQQTNSEESPGNAAVEGLNLVLAKLRRDMHEQGIERVDTLGREFDAETMRAIGVVATADVPSGHVAEQLSPGYRWQGRLLRFADVRVAE